MHISVVVPMYNVEPHVDGFLDAMERLEDPGCPYEIVLVDNGSTDGTRAVVEAREWARLLRQPDPGAYAARNLGILHSAGDVIALTDSDCAPDPHWLRAVAEAMADPTVGVVLGHTEPGCRTHALTLLDAYERAKEEWVFGSGHPELYFAQGGNMAVRRSLLDSQRPFDERRRGADVLLVRRLVDRYSLAIARYVPEMRVRHLEIRGAAAHLAKYRHYGTSLELYRRVVRCRSLGKHRLSVFRRTVSDNSLSFLDATLLLGLLAGGMMEWWAGSLRGRLLRREPGSLA